jgi:hypothetical protein
MSAYGENVRKVSADVREWGDTPDHVRERCLRAEAEVERLSRLVESHEETILWLTEQVDRFRAELGLPML